MTLNVIFGVFGSLFAACALFVAARIAWEAAKDLRYTSRLDEWGKDVAPW